MLNLLESIVNSGAYYVVRSQSEFAVGYAEGPAVLEACYDTRDSFKALQKAVRDPQGVHLFEPSNVERWVRRASVVDCGATHEDLLSIANYGLERHGLPPLTMDDIKKLSDRDATRVGRQKVRKLASKQPKSE